jgi:predicted TIM-barrel fold metal-dependent hydrolase
MATTSIATDIPVIDCDSHISEPADLWTSRLPSKLKDLAPRVELEASTGRMRWHVGEHLLSPVGTGAHAGWKEWWPSYPPTLEEADPASYDPVERVRRLDEYGIHAQLLFPNVIAFEVHAFMALRDPELRLACARAYNDFQTEFCSVAPDRLIPQMFLPFWDIEASLAEMRRCADMGHKAINWGIEFEKVGLPPARADYWTPVLSQAQDMGLPLTFHIGFNSAPDDHKTAHSITDMRDFAMRVSLFMIGNAKGIAEVIMSGMCERFPRLRFVSIESGYGYIPYLLESLDWQYLNMGGRNQFKDFLMPSEYFRRQVYASFWFEQHIDRLVDLYPDNLMFSSDFPHPTSLSPGPGSFARNARETIEANLADVPADVLRKILSENAARVYNL